ncbi:hypothetical protein BGW38_001986 [Lunasporangiospora selenospora]|uniref:Uncharacterized protein n=1 Tax=Lunasporangiospora selenospora TaxID=979761 RepID=A0A9P6FSP2_9FUNG|nr:hypothetical protein BGW38_001986 [Lunasporangiospora selenospora]
MDAKKASRTSGDGRDKSTGKGKKQEDEPVPSGMIAWAHKIIDRKEEITMVNFSNAFGFTREEDAHVALMSLLSSHLLPARARNAAIKTYELWRKNEGIVFWAWRSAGRKVDVSTGMTVEDLVDRG